MKLCCEGCGHLMDRAYRIVGWKPYCSLRCMVHSRVAEPPLVKLRERAKPLGPRREGFGKAYQK